MIGSPTTLRREQALTGVRCQLAASELTRASLDRLTDAIQTLPVPDVHRDLLALHASAFVETGDDGTLELPAAEIPQLVHAAIAGSTDEAIPVAAACTAVFLGADIFDNVADDEVPAWWAGHGPQLAALAGATYLSVFPNLLLSELTDHPRRQQVLDVFTAGLLAMSAGQHADLRADSDIDVASVRRSVEGKSGAEFELFARSGAVLATDDGEFHDRYGAFGLALGAAVQLLSDVADVFARTASGQTSDDLRNGSRTLPIVHALGALPPPRRRLLEEALASCRRDLAAHDQVRSLLVEAGSITYTLLTVGVYRQQALSHLERARPREPAGSALVELVHRLTDLQPDG